MPLRVVSVVGARPQFVKLAPIAHAFAATDHEHRVIHTGQHYDARLSQVFFDELGVPDPDWNLGVGSGSQGQQTGSMLQSLEVVLDEQRPDWVLVYGDTNSTLAGALAAVKLHLPTAHLEAGLRSFNRRMPEEHNRVLTDHASDLLLAPTAVAVDQLSREALSARTVLVGDVMADVLLRIRDEIGRAPAPALPYGGPEDDYVVATVHRAENTDDPSRLSVLVKRLAELPLPVRLLVHPRLAARAESYGISLEDGAIQAMPPLPYRSMVAMVLRARAVVTDSGGLQKEAFLLGVPCATLRAETEWPETLKDGWNVLAGDLQSLTEVVTRERPSPVTDKPFGTGNAAAAVVRVLETYSAVG